MILVSAMWYSACDGISSCRNDINIVIFPIKFLCVYIYFDFVCIFYLLFVYLPVYYSGDIFACCVCIHELAHVDMETQTLSNQGRGATPLNTRGTRTEPRPVRVTSIPDTQGEWVWCGCGHYVMLIILYIVSGSSTSWRDSEVKVW